MIVRTPDADSFRRTHGQIARAHQPPRTTWLTPLVFIVVALCVFGAAIVIIGSA